MKQFTDSRKKGRQVGPKWIRQAMKREVRKVITDVSASDKQKAAAKLFQGKSGWLRRFCKRHRIVLRRKTNVKKVPIEKRLPHIKRWFAIFRLQLLKSKCKRGYNKRYGIYEPKNRWSLDQVPAGLYDPKSTYEFKGTRRVHVACNGTADSHRFCTLQVLLRNLVDDTKPRRGQPRLCICFRGTGARISKEETDQYHEDVFVMWQKKAWYDSKTCNKWVVDYACDEIVASDCAPGQMHLILCDNLGG